VLGVAPTAHLRHHVVQAPHRRFHPAHAVEAPPALPRVDRLAHRRRFPKTRLFKIGRACQSPPSVDRRAPCANPANFLRQAHLHHMPLFTAWATRSAPLAAWPLTALRTAQSERLAASESRRIPKRICAFPSSRLCRNKCGYTARSYGESRSCGTAKSSV
jgi:hypothetical protein